jgi:hypothetical protein
MELLCGYVGHNVSERKALEARKSFAQRMMNHETVELRVTPEELQKICNTISMPLESNPLAFSMTAYLGMTPAIILLYSYPLRAILRVSDKGGVADGAVSPERPQWRHRGACGPLA